MSLTGFINIIKPTGKTSSNVVCDVKKILGTKKVGHLGTLDPAASGVLPIAVGRATKFFDYFLQKEKEYVAMVVFGKSTDTLDAYGQVVGENELEVTENMICSVLDEFVGEIEQVPPKFSAIKVDGKRAYDLARENADFQLKARKITIFSLKLLKKCEKNKFLFKVHCSAGTYIRTLFSDIATRLGTISYTPVIIRTKSGAFLASDAITLEELQQNKSVLAIEEVFKNFDFIEVDEKNAKRLINGQKLTLKDLKIEKKSNLADFFLTFQKKLIGLYGLDGENIVLKIYLYEGESQC